MNSGFVASATNHLVSPKISLFAKVDLLNGWPTYHSHLVGPLNSLSFLPGGMGGTSMLPRTFLVAVTQCGLLREGMGTSWGDVLTLTFPFSLTHRCACHPHCIQPKGHPFPFLLSILALPTFLLLIPTVRETLMWTQSWRTGSTGSSLGCQRTRDLPRQLLMMAA